MRFFNSSSSMRVKPFESITAITGYIPRIGSGPPVALSSSAAWNKDSIARSIPSLDDSSPVCLSFRTVLAWRLPDPEAAKSLSS